MTNSDPTDFKEWMRDVRRRLAALENRPPAVNALALLGPGIDSTAALVSDWNDDTIFFNGTYYSEIGANNAPDTTHRWTGLTLIDTTGSGYQLLVSIPDTTDGTVTTWTHLRRQRVFNTPPASTRVYSSWVTA